MVALVRNRESRNHRVGGDVARGLDGCHEVDDGKADDGGWIECDAPLERDGNVEREERARLERHHVEAEEGNQVADDDAEDDRAHAQEPIRRAVELDNRQQDGTGNGEVLPARERELRILGHRAESAATGDHADLDESESDEGDDNARDKRRNDFAQVLEEERGNHLGRCRADAASEDERQDERLPRGRCVRMGRTVIFVGFVAAMALSWMDWKWLRLCISA